MRITIGRRPPKQPPPDFVFVVLTCAYCPNDPVVALRWVDGVEQLVCAPHQAWIFDAMDELDLIMSPA